MKSLVVLSLLVSLGACSLHKNASEVDAAPGGSAGESQADELIGKYGYDKPLEVNLDQFRKVARTELAKRFGKIADQGEIIHKDMIAENAGTFFDMNRLYYVVKVDIDPRITNGANLYAAYMMTTQGYSAVGYANVTNSGRRDISWLFAGYAIGYNKILLDEVDEDGEKIRDKAKEAEVLNAAVEKYSEAFPMLTFSSVGFINTFFAEPPRDDLLNPSAEHLEAFSKFLDMTKTDENIEYIEIQPEYANFMPADHVTSFGEGESKTIDMNSLRSISLTLLREGNRPQDGLVPYLPLPFGDGVARYVED